MEERGCRCCFPAVIEGERGEEKKVVHFVHTNLLSFFSLFALETGVYGYPIVSNQLSCLVIFPENIFWHMDWMCV